MSVYNIITNMPLIQLSMVAAMIIFIAIVLIIVNEITYRRCTTKTVVKESELSNANVFSVTKDDSLHKTLVFAEIFFLVCGLAMLLCISCFSAQAKIKGAYGDFEKEETIASIYEAMAYGFTDESNDLPENLNGSIIVYFKYGCKDCYKIHNEIESMLTDSAGIYFVSTKSNRGEELLENYPVPEVPAAVYILNTPSDLEYVSVLLYEPSNENTDDSVFIKENLTQLIELQKEGL